VSPTLLVLAAGRGSRFGGAKQFEPMGPHGETMLDYSVFDAVRAGFGRVVFVVAPDALVAFRQAALRRYGGHVAVDCVCQDLRDCPPGFVVPPGRTRPWGTLHAVLAARHAVNTPFGVVNADDFYGRDAFVQLARFLGAPARAPEGGAPPPAHCMVAYALSRTLSRHGGVNRGICDVQGGFLQRVVEHTGIVVQPDGGCTGIDGSGRRVRLDGDPWVSMNVWGFTPSAWAPMQAHFQRFLEVHGSSPDAECYLPALVDALVDSGQARCRVLHTTGNWCGMTYREDKAHCLEAIAALVGDSTYPPSLWELS
jgi:hypothetical protein